MSETLYKNDMLVVGKTTFKNDLYLTFVHSFEHLHVCKINVALKRFANNYSKLLNFNNLNKNKNINNNKNTEKSNYVIKYHLYKPKNEAKI